FKILAVISESVEFDQIKVRESEAEELEQLEKEAPCQVKGGPTSTPGKVNILLQAYISRLHVEDFALISDTAYVAQNAARIARALVDIGVWKKLADTARVMIEMAKCIDSKSRLIFVLIFQREKNNNNRVFYFKIPKFLVAFLV
ncbi:Sec63 Brl domain-containing protein, partial [Phakopsora pachyrhizi]